MVNPCVTQMNQDKLLGDYISKDCVLGMFRTLASCDSVREEEDLFLQFLHNINYARQLSKHVHLEEIKLTSRFSPL